MPRAALHRFPLSAPDDMSALVTAMREGRVDPAAIRSVWIKTAGNGLRNDHSRALADLALRCAVADALQVDRETLRQRIVILASGGSEGVVAPHMVVFTGSPAQGTETGLVLGVASAVVPPASIGREAHRALTASLTQQALAQARLEAPRCGLVLVRTPTDPARPGEDGAARAAAALGTAVALGEIDDAIAPGTHARRAFVVARHDGAPQQVLVLGNAPGGDPRFQIATGTLRDPIDSPGVAAILRQLGLAAAPQLPPEESARVLAVISKGDAPSDGMIRGLPHVMSIDNDVAMHRHARAAYGTLLASAIGHTACLVSGGAEGQGPPQGGFASIIASTGQH